MESVISLKTTRKEEDNIDLSKNLSQITTSDCANLLKEKMNINTLGELLLCNMEELRNIFKELRYNGFDQLLKDIHDAGFLLNGEKETLDNLNISYDIALIPIKETSLSKKIKRIFKNKTYICYLGDLLTYNYLALSNIYLLTDEDMIEIKNYVHSLGFKLRNEIPTTTEIRNKNGKNAVDNLGLSNRVLNILYKNKIYTIRDLVDYGPRVFKLFGMGNVSIEEIKTAMKRYNLKFSNQNDVEVKIDLQLIEQNPNPNILKKVVNDNAEIQDRINKKMSLLEEYNKLLEEQDKLLKREKEIDIKLQELLEQLNSQEESEKVARR